MQQSPREQTKSLVFGATGKTDVHIDNSLGYFFVLAAKIKKYFGLTRHLGQRFLNDERAVGFSPGTSDAKDLTHKPRHLLRVSA